MFDFLDDVLDDFQRVEPSREAIAKTQVLVMQLVICLRLSVSSGGSLLAARTVPLPRLSANSLAYNRQPTRTASCPTVATHAQTQPTNRQAA